MIDWLVVWGVTQAAGVLVQPILADLAKDAAKDFGKDFFKDALKKVIHLPENDAKDALKEAYGKALKEFLESIQYQLGKAGYQEATIKEYIPSLKKFIANQEVAAALGKAFDGECWTIDTTLLAQKWKELNLPILPDSFNWDSLSDSYVKEVKKLVQSSEKLRPIFAVQLQAVTAEAVQDLAGIQQDFDLRKYAEGLKERYGNLKLESLNTDGCAYNALKLWRMFVPQQVRECQEFMPQVYELPKDRSRLLQEAGQLDVLAIREGELEDYRQRYREQPIKPIFEVVGDPQMGGKQGTAKYTVILGDPGSGKSTLLQYIALIWAEQPVRDLPLQPLPLLLELRTYARDKQAGRCKDIVSFIHEGNITCRLNQQELHAKLKKGDAIALFDGIDEVFDPELREEVVTDIHRFTNEYPLVRVVATSRWLGYKAQQLRDAEFQHFMLQDLDDEQVKDFLQRWHDLTFVEGQEKEQKRERLQKAIRESKSIHELAGNPLLLTMMAILNRNQELPRDRPELYNQASRVLLHQWDVERALVEDSRIDPKIIDYRDKQAILRKVAHYMQSSAKGLAGNLISGEQLEGILMDYLRTIDIEKPREITRVMINQLRTRNFILCDLGANSYGFVHRTFLEYFCAWEFVWQFEKDKTLTIEQLIQDVFSSHWQDESWHEVLRLICGMIEPKFVGEIIDFLLEQNDKSEIFHGIGWLKKERISKPLLAVNCFVEVRNTKLITDTLNKLLKILQGEVEQEYSYTFNYETASTLINIIASIGKDNSETLLFLKDRAINDRNYNIRGESVQVIAQGWREDPNTLTFLKACAFNDKNSYVRYEAVEVIMKYWKEEPRTICLFKDYAINNKKSEMRRQVVRNIGIYWREDVDIMNLLKDRAVNDDNNLVRWEAVYAIAGKGKIDLDIMNLLKDRAANDENEQVRSISLNLIIQYCKEYPDILTFLKNRAINDDSYYIQGSAIEAIARYWKEDSDTLTLLKDYVNNRDKWVKSSAIEAIAQYWKEDPDTLTLFKDYINNRDGWVRNASTWVIAKYWKEAPGILNLLKNLAINDPHEYVRESAVSSIAKYWKDNPDALALLKDRTINDDCGRVRMIAIWNIAKYWKEDPDNLIFLKNLAINDKDSRVRANAVEAIAQEWKEDIEILNWLKDCAINDLHEDVRGIVIKVIARYRQDYSNVLNLIKDCAINDQHEYVRKNALEVITEYWREDPDTLPFFQNYAFDDESWDVRRAAVEAISQGWEDDLKTFEFLYDFALHDPFIREENSNYYPRQTALEAILEYYSDNPQTLELLRHVANNDPDEKLKQFAQQELAKLSK